MPDPLSLEIRPLVVAVWTGLPFGRTCRGGQVVTVDESGEVRQPIRFLLQSVAHDQQVGTRLQGALGGVDIPYTPADHDGQSHFLAYGPHGTGADRLPRSAAGVEVNQL